MVPRTAPYHLNGMRHEAQEAELARIIREAMAEAAVQGLCRDGQIEFACGRLAEARPQWPAAKRLAFVTAAEDTLRK